jgi:NTE family protein
MDDTTGTVRLGLVLSAGGLRGAAHLGVLRQLVRHNIPIDSIVGASAGAVVAAYYAAVGLSVDELMADAANFRGRHLLTHSLNVRLGYRFDRRLRPRCGVIPARLAQLATARFDRLHHGVGRIGIVCHDLATRRPRYFGSGFEHGAELHEIVRASASIPFLFPKISPSCDETCQLTDGGLSDPVPIAFARGPLIGATHLIVSDCRWLGRASPSDARTIWIRHRAARAGTLWSPRRGLLQAVQDGEAAVTDEILDRVRGWLGGDDRESRLATAV